MTTILSSDQLQQLRHQAEQLKLGTAEGHALPVRDALSVIATNLIILTTAHTDALNRIIATLDNINTSHEGPDRAEDPNETLS